MTLKESTNEIFACLTLLAVIAYVAGCDAGRPANVNSEPSTTPIASTSSPALESSRGYWQVDSDKNPVTGEITTTAYLSIKANKTSTFVRGGRSSNAMSTLMSFLKPWIICIRAIPQCNTGLTQEK